MTDHSTTTHAQDTTAEPMAKMHHDHAECILFGEKLMHIARHGEDRELEEAAAAVRQYNIDELEPHLQHEEQTVLRLLMQKHPEHAPLCISIGREHGTLRTLAETLEVECSRETLHQYGALLKSHTQMEDNALFPLLETLLNEEEMRQISDFTPFQRNTPQDVQVETRNPHPANRQWLVAVDRYFNQSGNQGNSLILLPKFNPEACELMSAHLGLDFFDYQKEIMADYGVEAETITMDQLMQHLKQRAAKSGIVAHNIEALLCTKTDQARKTWMQAFLDESWDNPVLATITLYQADAPEEHLKVCDLELYKMPN